MLGTRNPNHKNTENVLFGTESIEPIEQIEPVKTVEKVKDIKEEPVVEKKSVVKESDNKMTSDKVYDLTKTEQIEILTKLGLSERKIKALRYESDRVNKILELSN